MRIKLLTAVIALSFFTSSSNGVELLDISKRCVVYSGKINEDIYGFSTNQDAEKIVKRIMQHLENADLNFDLKAANIRSALATIVNGKRIILYNNYFVAKALSSYDDEIAALIVFAHAIAHHALKHDFDKNGETKHIMSMELEADRFAGELIRKIGIRKNEAISSFNGLSAELATSIIPFASRKEQFAKAWSNGIEQPKFMAYASIGFEENIPFFPWPPPKASAFVKVPIKQNHRPTKLLEVADILESAFEGAGYIERSYYAVPQGFALVSRLERINNDGSPKELPDRWSTRIRQPTKFTLKSYFKALFTAPLGRFRIIVFIVTSTPFNQKGASLSLAEAEAWLSEGLDVLPKDLGNAKFTIDHKCTSLIYEFEKTQDETNGNLMDPSQLTGFLHLQRASLWYKFQ